MDVFFGGGQAGGGFIGDCPVLVFAGGKGRASSGFRALPGGGFEGSWGGVGFWGVARLRLLAEAGPVEVVGGLSVEVFVGAGPVIFFVARRGGHAGGICWGGGAWWRFAGFCLGVPRGKLLEMIRWIIFLGVTGGFWNVGQVDF